MQTELNGAAAGEGDEILRVAKELKKLRKTGSVNQIMPLLRSLQGLPMTVADLSRTKVGSIVNKLAKKHDDLGVRL